MSIVNLPTYSVSMMASYKSVAKIERNLIVCVKIFCIFREVSTNRTYRDHNRVNAPYVLYFADVS